MICKAARLALVPGAQLWQLETMISPAKRSAIVSLALGLALALFAWTPNAHAAQLEVRTGEHDGYSRIVFEWDESFSYQLQKQQQALKISFNKAAQNYDYQLETAQRSNLRSLSKSADTPLILTLGIPEGSDYRDLKLGRKLILDIYDPPGGKPEASSRPAPQEPQQQARQQPETPSQPETVEAEPPSQDTLGDSGEAEQTPEPEERAAPAPRPAQEQKRRRPARKLEQLGKIMENNLITVSSTQSMAMAVFEEKGDLWIVVDKPDLFIRPQAAGPKAEALEKAEQVELENGQAFRVQLPGAGKITSSGSGLLWRIKLGPKGLKSPDETDPIAPERMESEAGNSDSRVVFYPLPEVEKIVNVPDPITGRILKAVTVRNARSYAGPERSYVEFDALHSPAGLTIRPKVDDLSVRKVQGGVEISRPGGLNVLPEEVVASVIPRDEKADSSSGEAGEEKSGSRNNQIYNFRNWASQGAASLEKNRSAIMAMIPNLDEGQQIEKLISLGKMHLANGYGAEALGFFELAEMRLPELGTNPEFIAMKGAAMALDWKSEDAFNELSTPSLRGYKDVGYWKAYALADLGDWNQAAGVLPEDIDALQSYPRLIRNRLAIGLAEVFLRDGNVSKAEQLLDEVEKDENKLSLPHRAALKYLRGEAARQKGELETTYELWEELIDSEDDLYRAKAGLAHTRLKIDEDELEPDKAIDTLERLRYSWRGDELETQVNYWLGRTYFEGDNFLKGLRIMRESASIAPTADYAQDILEEMEAVYSNLYLGDKLDGISALDAIALYEQFAELLPRGEKGNRMIAELAGHLINANMLGKAADLLDNQIQYRLDDQEALAVGLDLAKIYMMDGKPQKVLDTLDTVENKMSALPADYPKGPVAYDIMILRIKAYSELDRPDQALELLEQLDRTPETNKLRADVAWSARYWDEAADALNDVILDQEISLTRPLTDEQASLILNRAIALNLDSDRIAIANMREKYTTMMDQTDKGRIFEVITRPRQNVRLADRDTLLSNVSEVDLFKDFMDSYRRTLVGEGEEQGGAEE